MHSEFPCDRAECSVLPRTGVGPDRHAPGRYVRDGFPLRVSARGRRGNVRSCRKSRAVAVGVASTLVNSTESDRSSGGTRLDPLPVLASRPL